MIIALRAWDVKGKDGEQRKCRQRMADSERQGSLEGEILKAPKPRK